MWEKGQPSAALGAQLQQEKGVFLSLLKLCSRTLINEELLSFQIYGNLEKQLHMKSRGKNIEFQRHLNFIYVNISTSKFWTEPSLKSSGLPVTAGWNGVPDWPHRWPWQARWPGEIRAVGQLPHPSLSHVTKVQGHPWITGECGTVNLQAQLRNFLGSEGLQSKVLTAPSTSYPPIRSLLTDSLSSLWFFLAYF